MKDFVFHNPTRIVFGSNSLEQVGPLAAPFGKSILFVYGKKSIRQSGADQAIRKSLTAAGITPIEHGGVQANPLLSHVREGIRLAKAGDIGAVLAVGGGSVMDSAKAIAAGTLVQHDVWQFFRGKKAIRQALPIICIPTIAGSGSETNPGMVLTHDETRQKIGIGNKYLQPHSALLDPALTFSVPPHLTACGAVDTIAHLLEFYFNREEAYAPLQDHYAASIIRSVMASGETAMATPADHAARADLLWAGSLAMNGLAAAGLGRIGFPLHMIEHAISGLYDIPHGAGLAALLCGWLHLHCSTAPLRMANFSRMVFKTEAKSPEETALLGIESLQKWLLSVKAPTRLSDLGIRVQDIPEIAGHAEPQARLWRLREYDTERILKILRHCF